MSERLGSFRNLTNKEILENKSEKRPEWQPWEDTKCEAKLDNKTTRRSVQRFVYDGDGKRHDLGAGTVEHTGRNEGTLNCSSKFCPHVMDVPFDAEGMGYGPYNQVNRDAAAWLQENCGKWQARLEKGGVSGKMPDKELPFRP